MKSFIKQILERCGYRVRIQKVGEFEDQIQRETHEIISKANRLIGKLSPDLSILNGPFRGMRYPSTQITELAFLPKISGVYEKQLQPLIEEIAAANYDSILDIGCAEGYYAVGLGMLSPRSTVHCYDINEADLEFCRRMAELNRVDNIICHGACSPETLMSFDYGDKSLIFCDCEGFELQLFTDAAVAALGHTDVLVEMHDIFNPTISATLLQRFARTHDVRIFDNSRNDYRDTGGLNHLTSAERYEAIFEHRGAPYQHRFMEWAFFTPRK